MNRNEVIDTVIGKTLGYTVQCLTYTKLAQLLNLQSVILIRSGVTYGIKIFKYDTKNYIRKDFRSETIFSDAVDAIFFAD